MAAGSSRAFPVQSSNCGLPADAQVYSLNVTAVPRGPLGYLTMWPSGAPQPLVSTLNATDWNLHGQRRDRAGGQQRRRFCLCIQLHRCGAGCGRILCRAGHGGFVALHHHAMPGARYPAKLRGLQGTLEVAVEPSACGPSINCPGICFERYRRAAARAGFLILVAERGEPTHGLYLERHRWSGHVQHGHRAHEQREHRRLLLQLHPTDPRPLQLLRAVGRYSRARLLRAVLQSDTSLRHR